MKIRKALEKDIPRINELLRQVCNIHHEGRPDLFRENGRKYSVSQLMEILTDERTPVLAAVDDNDRLEGYAFCIFKEIREDSVLNDCKSLYIDDLCVDAAMRGKGIGRKLFLAARELAKESGCYNLTLNVWNCNSSALEFYKKCGLRQQKTIMEDLL